MLGGTDRLTTDDDLENRPQRLPPGRRNPMTTTSRRLPLLFKALALPLVLGFIVFELSQAAFPLISPWEFAIYYTAGLALVLAIVLLILLMAFIRRKARG
jgi:hypothetical protein